MNNILIKSLSLGTAALAITIAANSLFNIPTPALANKAISQTPLKSAAIHQVKFNTEKIDGINIAYREAGNPKNPTVLLLHGFPTSSHMYRNLIPKLAKKYHVLAPDYPGFGASDMPTIKEFNYTFENISNLIAKLLESKKINRYAVYLMDYGAPVGYRLFANNPEKVTGFIIQNGNAYEEGLSEFWKPIKAYWANPSIENGDKLRGFLKLGATKWQFTHGTQNPKNISPDNFWHVQYLLDRPGNQEIQLKLFLDYGTNLKEYPKWHALFRQHQPPALLVWGKNDPIFPEAGAHPYKKDLKNLEFHIINTGHFALEEYGTEIGDHMLKFLGRIKH